MDFVMKLDDLAMPEKLRPIREVAMSARVGVLKAEPA